MISGKIVLISGKVVLISGNIVLIPGKAVLIVLILDKSLKMNNTARDTDYFVLCL